MDVWDGTTWRTILVGGLNAGGRGFYALDITNPRAPRALWEFCSDAKLCPEADEDLGLSFGNPVISKRASDGRWVVMVTSGLNNTVPGNGRGFLYVLDALSGKVLEKVDTQEGTEKAPLGLARIAAWADNFMVDNTAKWVYGGDQQGNVWKFDLTASPVKVMRLARALDASGAPQPITTRPELGLVDGTYRVIFVGTGRYLGVRDLTDPATQTPPGTGPGSSRCTRSRISISPWAACAARPTPSCSRPSSSWRAERSARSRTPRWTGPRSNGWYVDLNPGGKSVGERVTIDPQLALGTLLVTTNVPGASACSIGGDSWVYQFDYRSGTYVAGSPNNLVARKQTGALTAGLVVYQLQKGSLVGQIQRSETTTRREDIVTATPPMKSRRTSWREVTPGIE